MHRASKCSQTVWAVTTSVQKHRRHPCGQHWTQKGPRRTHIIDPDTVQSLGGVHRATVRPQVPHETKSQSILMASPLSFSESHRQHTRKTSDARERKCRRAQLKAGGRGRGGMEVVAVVRARLNPASSRSRLRLATFQRDWPFPPPSVNKTTETPSKLMADPEALVIPGPAGPSRIVEVPSKPHLFPPPFPCPRSLPTWLFKRPIAHERTVLLCSLCLPPFSLECLAHTTRPRRRLQSRLGHDQNSAKARVNPVGRPKRPYRP